MKLRVGDVIDLDVGGSGESLIRSCCSNISLNNTEMMFRDLKSNDSVITHGKLIFDLSTQMERT